MQLLIRAVSQPHINKKIHASRAHRGDVIAKVSNDHVWSANELTNPRWRIIIIGDFLPVEVESLIASEIDVERIRTRLWKRQRKLNLQLITTYPAFIQYFNDETRAEPTFTVLPAKRSVIKDAFISKGRAEDL